MIHNKVLDLYVFFKLIIAIDISFARICILRSTFIHSQTCIYISIMYHNFYNTTQYFLEAKQKFYDMIHH